MTRDEIIRMALECELLDSRDDLDHPAFAEILVSVERFADLVAAAEQNRCIGIIYGQCGSDNVAQRTVDAIRSQS